MNQRPTGARPCVVEPGIEAALLGAFMVSASAFTILLEHPVSPVRAAMPDPFSRRAVMGLGMAATAAVLIDSSWGRRSGAHMNPATTLALLRLGRISPRDAGWYIVGQFLGGSAGMAASSILFGPLIEHPAVAWVVTRPGPRGAFPAFAAELLMTTALMGTVLALSSCPGWRDRTGWAASALVGIFIAIEAPVSGMSLNPARTLGPAMFSGDYTALWIYFTAPVAGMFLAAEAFLRKCHPACETATGPGPSTASEETT